MLTVDARVELFKKEFPQEKIKSVIERQGTDHEVVEINHTWMCKSAKTQAGVASLQREYHVLQALQGKILTQIPQPVHYQENFLVYKKIPGSPLIPYTFFRLGHKQRSKLICEVVQFLQELHTALSPEQIQTLHIPGSDWPWSVQTIREEMETLELKPEVKEFFAALVNMYSKSIESKLPATLLHNDLSLHNIIIDPLTGQLRGIIDFADVCYDEPILDLRLRRDTPYEFSQALMFVYGLEKQEMQAHDMKRIHYYFATEISRYLQLFKDADYQAADQTLQVIGKLFEQIYKNPVKEDESLAAEQSAVTLGEVSSHFTQTSSDL